VQNEKSPQLVNADESICLAVDAMGTDAGPAIVVQGAAKAVRDGLKAKLIFFGDEALLKPLVAAEANLHDVQIQHAPDVVVMTDKPAHVLRRGRETSMWKAITAVKDGRADAIVSGGNTGALMALSRFQLRMINDVDRPAITALWPTPTGRGVVLDVGANIEASDMQLVQFAVMGEAFYRALTGKEKPTLGLLNVGAEELKGHVVLHSAANTLRTAITDLDYRGFVEGNDISKGAVDVVVTDGFSGNIALKAAEGAARLVGGWMGEAVKNSWRSKLGGLLMMGQLKGLRKKIDPSSVNGGVFLGLNGVVVKSHGGADAAGVASAISIAENLARRSFIELMAAGVSKAMVDIADAATELEALSVKDETAGSKDVKRAAE